MKGSEKKWNSLSTREAWVHGARKGRGLRILPKGEGYFVHVTSRTRGQEFLFGEVEKKSFLLRMRQWSAFSGIGVLTHCLMSNHFHLLLWVPPVSKLSHPDIVSRLKMVWPEDKVDVWERLYSSQNAENKKAMDRKIQDRMGNLPDFMRVLKQSFSNWYNHREGCTGTLWEGRYRSVVVEDSPLALLSVAAYIDLNPLRAGLISDPMQSPWTGYGAACGGDTASKFGLDFLIRCSRGEVPNPALLSRRNYLLSKYDPEKTKAMLRAESKSRKNPLGWEDVQKAYRIWLYAKGRQLPDANHLQNTTTRKGISPQKVLAEYEQNGEVPYASVLLQKWRCFSRGVGIGSPQFLDDLFKQYRSCFGPKRVCASRKLPNGFPGLGSLRQVD